MTLICNVLRGFSTRSSLRRRITLNLNADVSPDTPGAATAAAIRGKGFDMDDAAVEAGAMDEAGFLLNTQSQSERAETKGLALEPSQHTSSHGGNHLEMCKAHGSVDLCLAADS